MIKNSDTSSNIITKIHFLNRPTFSPLIKNYPNIIIYSNIMGNYNSNQLIPFDYVQQVSTMITNDTNILTYNDFHTSNMGPFSDSDSDSKSNNIIWALNDFDGLSYNDINIDFARIGSSFAILNDKINDKKITNTKYFDKIYDTFIKEYKSELNDLYELNPNSNPKELTTLDIKLDNDKYKDIGFLKKVKDRIISDKEFLKKYILNGKFIRSDQIIKIDTNLYTTISTKLAEKYHNIKIYDIVQKLYSGGSSFGSLKYYVYAKYAKYSNDNIILEIKQLTPIYDPINRLIFPKANTIYNYTKLINAYSWTNLFNYLTINNSDYVIRFRDSASSVNLEEKDFNNFKEKDFEQYMQISAKLLAKFHYNSLLNEKINICDYLEYLKTNIKIITNNMKAFSISYVDINKKYFLYYKRILAIKK